MGNRERGVVVADSARIALAQTSGEILHLADASSFDDPPIFREGRNLGRWAR